MREIKVSFSKHTKERGYYVTINDGKFLETLGFVVGGTVTVVSEINGNMIVNVKDSRVAIGKDMANKIMV